MQLSQCATMKYYRTENDRHRQLSRIFLFFFRDKLLADEQMNPFFQQMGLGSKLNFQFFKTLLTPHCTVAGPLECMGTWGLVSSPNVLADMSKV